MRQALLISLSLIYLAGSTELIELFKVHKLLIHYFQHHRQDSSLSFFRFIEEHYSGNDGTSADDDLDRQLPGHDIQHHNTFFNVYSPTKTEVPTIGEPVLQAPVFNYLQFLDHSSKHVFPLLHPPQIS